MASKNEKAAAKAGMTLKQYKASKGKKKSSKKSSSKSSDKSYKDTINSILKATPAQQATLPDFDTTVYTPELQAEDMAQSEALYKPFFQNEIENELQDLNAWSQTETTNYERSLRRARISLGQGGGAIGGERQRIEGEMSTDRNAERTNTLRATERMIGTEALTGAGFGSTGNQEGEIVGKMKAAVQEGQLWYKNQRAARYYGDANRYYTQPTNVNLLGGKL